MKHFDIYINTLARFGASWEWFKDQQYACWRNLFNVLKHYFIKNFGRRSLTGHARFHATKIDENNKFVIDNTHTDNESLFGKMGYKVKRRMDICVGLDCGALHKTPLSVLSALLIICQLSNLVNCQNSLYNALPIALSYKKDSTYDGRSLVYEVCNNIGKYGEFNFWCEEADCQIFMKYQAHAQGDYMAKNQSINMSCTVRATYGGTQGFIWDVQQQQKRGLKWYADYTTALLMSYVPPDEVDDVENDVKIIDRVLSVREKVRLKNNSNVNNRNGNNNFENENNNDNNNNNGKNEISSDNSDEDDEMEDDNNIENDVNSNKRKSWWSLLGPELGNQWGHLVDVLFDAWVAEYRNKYGRDPVLTASKEDSIRTEIAASLQHGILRKGHALSFCFMCEIKHIMWRIQLFGLASDTAIIYCTCEFEIEDVDWCLDAFELNSIKKQFGKYGNKNKSQDIEKVMVYRLIGCDIDAVTVKNPEFLSRIDFVLMEKFDIDANIEYNDNSDMSSIDRYYFSRTWWLVVNWRAKELWQKFFAILHIPYFDPDQPLPDILKYSIELSIKIWDLIERFQSYFVSLFFLIFVWHSVFVLLFVCIRFLLLADISNGYHWYMVCTKTEY